MLMKVFPHGTGEGDKPSRYLVRPDYPGRDTAPPQVLRGEPAMTRALIDSIERRWKFTSGALSWHPDEKISVVSIQGDYAQKIVNQASSGELPDVFTNLDSLVGYLAKANVTLALDDYLAEANISKDDFYPSVYNLGIYNGKTYMLSLKVYETVKTDVAYVQDKTVSQIQAKDRILEYLKHKPSITNQKAQELCGFNKNQTYYILHQMCKDGILQPDGVGRGTKYKSVK